MASARPRLVQVTSKRPAIVEVEAKRPRLTAVVSKRPRFDYSSTAKPVVIVITGVAGLMQFLSSISIPANITGYLNASGFDSDWSEARIPVPAGTAGRLTVEATAAPGSGQTFTYAVLDDAGSPTGLTVTLSDLETIKSIATDVAYANDETLALRLITSVGAAAAKHKATLKFTPT